MKKHSSLAIIGHIIIVVFFTIAFIWDKLYLFEHDSLLSAIACILVIVAQIIELVISFSKDNS